MGVTINGDNTGAFMEEMPNAILRGLEKVGLVAEGYAKQMCPVDTGRLRNSVTHAVDNGETAAYIGTNVEYAPFIELGTASPKRDAQPFLVPAAQDHGDEYRAIMESELKG